MIVLDIAHEHVGGTGGPLFETYALEVAREQALASEMKFARRTSIVIRESGQTHEVVVLATLGADAHEMLDVMPVRLLVVRQVRPKYSCRRCKKIVQAPASVSAVARGKATFATLAHVVVSKFDHHLPLYRQAEMMAAQGLDIDRSTLAG